MRHEQLDSQKCPFKLQSTLPSPLFIAINPEVKRVWGCCCLGDFFMFYWWNSQAKCTQSDNEKLPLLHKDWVSRQELLVSWKTVCPTLCVCRSPWDWKRLKFRYVIKYSSDNEPLNLILVHGGSHPASGVCTVQLWERILPRCPHQVREG